MSKPRVFLITEPTKSGDGFLPNFERAKAHGELLTLLPEGYKASRNPEGASELIEETLIELGYNPDRDFLLWVNFADLHNYLTTVAVIAMHFAPNHIKTLAWAKSLDQYIPLNIEL